MIKALWFLLKVGLLVALVVWVADRPGTVRFDWVDLEGNDIAVNVHIGLFLAVLLGVILSSIFIYQTIKTFVDFPKSLSRYNEVKAREKGYLALTKGLSAVAAGDTRTAVLQSEKARRLLPEDTGLPLLLEAQAARLDGREADAAQSFVALLEDKNASFLGVRGLLQAALDSGDHETALRLANKALKAYPKQVWILQITYDLQLKQRLWEEACKTLKMLQNQGAVAEDKAQADIAAIFVAEGDEATSKNYEIYAEETYAMAAKKYPEFAPAVLRLAKTYMQGDEPKKVIKLIEKVWKTHPHETYVEIWASLMNEKKSEDPLERLKWFERLVKLNPLAAAGQLATGKAAIDAGLWGEAREYFVRAEELEPSAAVYQALAELEERSNKDEAAAKEWLSQAVSAPGKKAWVCRETGQIFSEWQAFVVPDDRFNTIEWGHVNAQADVLFLNENQQSVQPILEAPKTDAA